MLVLTFIGMIAVLAACLRTGIKLITVPKVCAQKMLYSLSLCFSSTEPPSTRACIGDNDFQLFGEVVFSLIAKLYLLLLLFCTPSYWNGTTMSHLSHDHHGDGCRA